MSFIEAEREGDVVVLTLNRPERLNAVHLEMRDELGTRLPGIMHGGAVGSLIDSAAGAATSTLREADDETWGGQATSDMNATFLAAATGRVVAEATVLRSSRSFSFVQVEVRAEDETLVAVGRATYTIIRKRS